MKQTIVILVIGLLTVLVVPLSATDPVDIGSRRELFVDHAMIERMEGRVELRLHAPTIREVAIKYDQPWEGNASGYATVFQDGEIYRMYYRGHRYLVDDKPSVADNEQRPPTTIRLFELIVIIIVVAVLTAFIM